MPYLEEQMYCSQQIVIPPKLPYILKMYCKAAIKTQPYDLLRWSYEYFQALADGRPPPVKLRLEYPIYNTEGGLTRGCLKVMANQLSSMGQVPLPKLAAAWQGFCLDPEELRRITCLCEVHMREETVSFLHFIAVAGGLLTKSLTNTMILLCETLTKEPEGGSAAVPMGDFLEMYRFLAKIDASADVKYYNGYREGQQVQSSAATEEAEQETEKDTDEEMSTDGYWEDKQNFHKISILDENVPRNPRLSVKLNELIIDRVERSPSTERAKQIERENYLRERRGESKISPEDDVPEYSVSGDKLANEQIEILDFDDEANKTQQFVNECNISRQNRREDLEHTFDEIETIVNKYKSTNYDLGMVAGRQMSITSGEFIVQKIEKEIMDSIGEQIAVLPDPDLKRKKAKPEEVAMIREILEEFLDEKMDVIAAEIEELEEEEEQIPDIVTVYAVPGIGGLVEEDIIRTFEAYALELTKLQGDVMMPRNIRHFLCPPLESYEETYGSVENPMEVDNICD